MKFAESELSRQEKLGDAQAEISESKKKDGQKKINDLRYELQHIKRTDVLEILISFAVALVVSIIFGKIILFFYAHFFPFFDLNSYPRKNLEGLPAWIIKQSKNVYICEVFEPCGHSLKVEVSLPVTETPAKWRTPVLLSSYDEEKGIFIGEFITQDEAVELFERKENEVFNVLSQGQVANCGKQEAL